MTTLTTASGRDPRQFATPTTPDVQTENTVDAAALDDATDQQDEARAAQKQRDDDRKQEKEAPKSDPDHDTTQLPPPEDGGHPVDDPPVNPKAGAQTEQRIERAIESVEKTGVVPPRSVLAPAKPAREPTEDEQRMAEDFDPPPLAHRADVGH